MLIRVRACGVCHGDLLLQQGGFPFARFPVVPGHEVAGEIAEVGEGVQWLKPGMRVGVSALYSACGQNKRCLGGDEILCAQGWEFTSVTKDGGYQEFMLAAASYVAPLPDTLDFAEAAPLMCAGSWEGAGSWWGPDLSQRQLMVRVAAYTVRKRRPWESRREQCPLKRIREHQCEEAGPGSQSAPLSGH